MELMNARGTKDFSPEEKIARNEVVDALREVFELYGFSPLDTPLIERFEILSAKYAGGAEILKETFKFQDQGGRDLGLRYDLTVPLSRYVGMNPTIKLPFKRYQMGSVFRDGPIKTGRMREFWQCDVDTVGTASMLADAECIKIAQTIFKKLGFDVTIEVNSRKVMNGLLASCNIPDDRKMDVTLEIDKLKKIGVDAVKEELATKDIQGPGIDKVMELMSTKGTNRSKIDTLKKILKEGEGAEGLKEIEELFSYLDDKNVVFSISLARGLTYYTGTVFEVFINTGELESALCAGGRYDKMIGQFLGAGKEYPAVGISFGIEPITAVMNKRKQEATKKTVTQAYIIPIKTVKESSKIAEELRNAGIPTDMDMMDRGISKNLAFANALSIPYAIFVGGDELAQKKVKLRDMKTGKEDLLSVADVCKKLKK